MTNATSAESEAARRRAAMAPLVAAHLDMVYAAALRQTRDPHMAEDVTQSVFLIAVKKAGRIPADRAAAWLMKVTRFVALTALRTQRRREHHERVAALETAAQADSPQAAMETHLDEALAALGQADRQLILLRYLQNQPVPQVAAALHIADNTASQRIGRALDKLRRFLRRRNVDVPLTALAAMLALAVRPAPRALAQRILQAAGAGAASAATGISLGVFLMTLTTKTALVLAAAAILLLAAFAGVHFSRPPAPAVVAVETRGGGLETLPILKIEVVGNVHTDSHAILEKIGSQAGQPYSRQQVDADVAAIAGLERFLTTRAEVALVEAEGTQPRGVNVRFIVDERPVASTEPGYTVLVGKVTDSTGKPVANALISQGDPPFLADGYFTTYTDAEGKYALRAKVGTELVVAAQLAGYAPELVQQGVVTEKMDPLMISLKPARTIRARIVDKRGNPVANLALEAAFWRQTQVLRVYTFEQGRWTGLRTDANGMLVWTDAPADEVKFDPLTDTYLRGNFSLTASDALQTVVLGDPIKVALTVTDAQTKEPVPSFSVVYGRGDAEAQANYWDDRTRAAGVNGKYATSLKWSYPYHFFRVEAPGYAPMVATFKEDQSEVALNVGLSKATGVTLAVVRPDGAPAAGAPVSVAPATQDFFNLNERTKILANPRFAAPRGNSEPKADASGRILLAAAPEATTRVIVADEAGYADVSLAEAAKSGKIALEAWARLDGVVLMGTKPAAEQSVWAQYNESHGQGKPYITGIFETKTDALGHFSFDRLPPGRMQVGRAVEANLGSRFQSGTTTHNVTVTLVGGQTGQVTIGGKGRAVAGRIVDGQGMALSGVIYSMAQLAIDLPPFKMPPEIQQKLDALRQLPQAEMTAAFNELQKTPEYAAMQKALEERNAKSRSYAFVIGADGAFRAEDIDAGEYTLSLTVADAKTYKELGVVKAPVTVPAGADGDVVPVGDLRMMPPQ